MSKSKRIIPERHGKISQSNDPAERKQTTKKSIKMLHNSTNEIESILKDLKKIENLCSKLHDKLEDDQIDETIDWQEKIRSHRLAYVLFDAAYDSETTIRELEKELKKRKEIEEERK